MREGALFAAMFGLGTGAVVVGVTVSRLVVGQPPEQPADESPVVAVEAPPPPAIVTPAPAVVSPAAQPPAVLPPAVEPPAPPAVERQHRTVARKHRRPPVEEQTPPATASVPPGEAEPAAPSPVVGRAPITIVRGGAVRPNLGARAPGPRIIRVAPRDDRR
jgi:hypothetical protein